MKKITACLLAMILMTALFSGCGTKNAEQTQPAETPEMQTQAPETAEPTAEETADSIEFTDDLGRTVTLPAKITSIAASGPLTQLYLLPLAGDLMAGFTSEFSEDMMKYLPTEYLNLPNLGQLYGGKGTMNLEELIKANPDFVLDLGEEKNNMAQDLDDLSEQTGIPFVHINVDVLSAAGAYREMGKLLDREEKAEELATYLEQALKTEEELMAKVDAGNGRKKLVYCLGDKGLNVLAKGSYHAETINLVSDNVAVVDDVVSSGAGNEIDMEQLMLWNPEVIIFAPNSVYASVGEDETWKQLNAIKNGQYYETPFGPYGWLQSPPAVQCYLGMMWLESLLYPEECSFDLQSEVTQYYKLFYGHDLTDEEYQDLTANALPKN